jgi:arsenate reductase
VEIWINPACSKCRAAAELLDDAGASYTVRRYLDDPPTPDELDAVLQRLGLEPWDIARMNEPAAQEAGLRDLPKDRGPGSR